MYGWIFLPILMVMVGQGELIQSNSGVSIQAWADPSTTELGRNIVYEVEATYPLDCKIEWPPLGEGLDEFQIQDFEVVEERKARGGRLTSGRRYILNTYVSGEYILPEVEVQYRFEDGREGYARASRIFVSVLSPDVDPTDELRDIAGPMELPTKTGWHVWVSSVFVLVAVCFLFVLWRKRRSSRAAQEKVEPPWEVALRELNLLDADRLVSEGEWKVLYVSISWLLRQYLEACFEVCALEETTLEIFQDLDARKVLEESAMQTLRLALDQCDLVKYARYAPGADEAKELKNRAIGFVTATIPVGHGEERAA